MQTFDLLLPNAVVFVSRTINGMSTFPSETELFILLWSAARSNAVKIDTGFASPGKGVRWINSILESEHRSYTVFRMRPAMLTALVQSLSVQMTAGRKFSVQEKVLISVHWLAQGITVRAQAEHWGRSLASIWKARTQTLLAIQIKHCESFAPASFPFASVGPATIPTVNPAYEAWIHHFAGCAGVVDGTHIPRWVPKNAPNADVWRNRKQYISSNVMIVCDHALRIAFLFSGAEGSAHDGLVLQCSGFMQSHMVALPEGVFILGDAGYPLVEGRLLVPYRGVRYHLQEFSVENPPRTARELFNLRHAKLRQVVERTIGLFKRRWRMLGSSSECSIDTFNAAVYSCAHLHNMIGNDVNPVVDVDASDTDTGDAESDAGGIVSGPASTPSACAWRDGIADAMWAEYQSC